MSFSLNSLMVPGHPRSPLNITFNIYISRDVPFTIQYSGACFEATGRRARKIWRISLDAYVNNNAIL